MPPGVNNNKIKTIPKYPYANYKKGTLESGKGLNPFEKGQKPYFPNIQPPFKHFSCMDCHYFGKDPVLLARKQLALSSEVNDVYVIDFTHGIIDSVKEIGVGIKDLLKFAYAVEVKTKELKMLLLKALIIKRARERLKEICVGIAATSRNSIEIIDDLMESVNSESVKEALGEYKNKLLNGDNEHSKGYYQGRFAVEVVLWAPVIYGLVLKGARIAGKAAKGLAELGGRMKGLVKLPEYLREGKLAGTSTKITVRDLIRDQRGSFTFKDIPSEKKARLTRLKAMLEESNNARNFKLREEIRTEIIKLQSEGDIPLERLVELEGRNFESPYALRKAATSSPSIKLESVTKWEHIKPDVIYEIDGIKVKFSSNVLKRVEASNNKQQFLNAIKNGLVTKGNNGKGVSGIVKVGKGERPHGDYTHKLKSPRKGKRIWGNEENRVINFTDFANKH